MATVRTAGQIGDLASVERPVVARVHIVGIVGIDVVVVIVAGTVVSVTVVVVVVAADQVVAVLSGRTTIGGDHARLLLLFAT